LDVVEFPAATHDIYRRAANGLTGGANILPATFRRIIAPLALTAAICGALLWLWATRAPRPGPPVSVPRAEAGPVRGGTLTATLRAEPATANRFASSAFPTHLLSLLTDARLVRIDPATDAPEPWLAESVTRASDTSIAITLRPGARFSDGSPVTPDDVVWSLKAAYATPQGGIGSALRIAGQEIAARADSDRTVTLTLPQPWAPAVRLLEVLPIKPRAAIEPALTAGTFAAACAMRAPCPGAGPFLIRTYEPGQRVVLSRNPHYWRRGENGAALPYLDGLTLAIVPNQDAELLRLRSGDADLLQSELRPEDIRALRGMGGTSASAKATADSPAQGQVVLTDLGPGLDRAMLWFNLGPAPVSPAKAFIRDDRFRLAVSLAVDREGLAETVYLGAATASSEPVPASNRTWTAADLPRPTYDPARAAALLDEMGLKDRDNDGVREDGSGRPVRFTVLVQSGISASVNGMAFLRDALANIGVALDVVQLDFGAVMGQWQKGDYDAIYQMIVVSDPDPAGNMDFWMSRGSSHLWHPQQKAPATPWEQEIDRRMLRVATLPDQAARVAEFAEVQRLMLTHNPVLWLASGRVYVAYNPRVGGVVPRLTRPLVLWRADELFVR
jgi:peptide/nickel transport system substrate-binding protein